MESFFEIAIKHSDRYDLIASNIQGMYIWNITSQDCHLCMLPLFHIAGLAMTMATIHCGGKNVIMERFNPEHPLQYERNGKWRTAERIVDDIEAFLASAGRDGKVWMAWCGRKAKAAPGVVAVSALVRPTADRAARFGHTRVGSEPRFEFHVPSCKIQVGSSKLQVRCPWWAVGLK